MTLTADFNSSVTVPFQRMRALLLESGGGLQEGIVGATDAKIAQRGAGANQTVDVPAGAMWISIDTGTRNGVGHVYNDATANIAVSASNATNPRIDQLVCRWNDSSIPTGSGNVPTFEVVTGTATGGATLDNRTGAAALPNDCLRLADILVPAASTSVVTANIRDRRPWARGASFANRQTGAADYTMASGSFVAIDATNLTKRLECSGVTLEVVLRCHMSVTVAPNMPFVSLFVDGVEYERRAVTFSSATTGTSTTFAYTAAGLAAGSHVFDMRWAGTVGYTTTMLRTSPYAVDWSLMETVRQLASND